METAVWIIVVALVVNCITNIFSTVMSVGRWNQQYGEWSRDRIHVRDTFNQLTEDMREHIEKGHGVKPE